ncbi:MAG: AsmA-like C-terminal region-containing protein, partial [Acetobacteraceae bacterium]
GEPIRADFTGPVLDLAARMAVRPPRPVAGQAPTPPGPPRAASPGPPWRASLRFARILLGKPLPDGTARALDGAVIGAASDGRRLTSLSLVATPVGGKPLTVSIAPGPGGRVLAAATDDAGALFRAADLIDRLVGGTLRLSARYADGQAGDPLTGTLEIDRFRVRRAPVLGKLLQAMTLYGLADALGGPGLAFHRLVAPFRLAGSILSLGPARAFSPSLGLTARGTIDRAAGRVALSGTIVPAYFFNSLLGNLPIVGRLFSPEKGSGLFAANYQVTGPIADPSVSVNPLSALTPGFLRGVFGLFGQPKPGQ